MSWKKSKLLKISWQEPRYLKEKTHTLLFSYLTTETMDSKELEIFLLRMENVETRFQQETELVSRK